MTVRKFSTHYLRAKTRIKQFQLVTKSNLYDSATNPQKSMFAFIFSVSSRQTDKVPPGLAFSGHTHRATRFGLCDGSYISSLSSLSHVFDINSFSL